MKSLAESINNSLNENQTDKELLNVIFENGFRGWSVYLHAKDKSSIMWDLDKAEHFVKMVRMPNIVSICPVDKSHNWNLSDRKYNFDINYPIIYFDLNVNKDEINSIILSNRRLMDILNVFNLIFKVIDGQPFMGVRVK